MSKSKNEEEVKQLSSNLFPVVGVGASAGGLEAFKKLITAIPQDSGTAFILVQHLEPTHESILTELLQKVTPIPILEITDNVKVEPNHIYIIPSNKVLTANDGVLRLDPRPPRNQKNMPIDVFFLSLAEVHQSHAIGVVLSGTATDGTLGLKAIKDRGGITFVQDPNSAAFEGMPQSAIDAEVVDFIMKPEEIPLQIMSLNRVLEEGPAGEAGDLQKKKEEIFRQLLVLIRIRQGTDFTYYKQTTIRRRIIRRMGLNKLNDIAAYLAFVRDNIPEQDQLYQDLMIPVTEFYRDPKTYDTLKASIFPLLFSGRESSNPIRIWIAGCSTGEEPYSMAMSLYEFLGEKAVDTRIQIFATDISEASVGKARGGIYAKREVASLSAEQLEKYFTKVNGAFQINKPIRDMCVFARHNFLKDPPFARMDLVSCRNVLIYMEPFLQKRALTTFHYALKENGFLLLGKSETTGPASELFTPFIKADKFYTRKAVPGNFLRMAGDRSEGVTRGKVSSLDNEGSREDFQKNADDMVLLRYGPPGVVVNEHLDIVQFRGSTGTWLESSPGKPSTNVIKMAREGLAFELRNILHKVKTGNKLMIKEDISIEVMGHKRFVTVEVIPLAKTAEPHYLILFKEGGPAGQPVRHLQKTANGDGDKDHELQYVERLENELAQLREDMRSITEDQEAVNEELQSANEELLSGSEELQSLNEELETSKEEIQSTNEELTTLNHELFDRNEQLNLSRIYAESIVATIREPLIILDRNLRVKTANRSYYDKFNTHADDTEGVLFHEIGSGQWNIPALRTLLEKILTEEGKIKGFEIRQSFVFLGERVMLVNMSPIFRSENAEQLILLAFEDITEAKKAEMDRQIFTQELTKLVGERTGELKEANISLKYSNEQLSQFATIASHDLQEPLRKIRTFANLLNLRHGGETGLVAKRLLEKISIAAERMSDLIRDLLNFSKVTDFRKAFEKTDLDVILEDTIRDLDLLISQKEAVVQHDRLPVIDAIPLQISQLFANLLGNALKFSRAGRPSVIHISCRSLLPEEIAQFPSLDMGEAYAEIIFSDNGIGFDPKFSAQLFQIFQRLNSREDFEGTGIGLALCKRIVVNHHGEIHATAIEGEGAQFRIILPLVQKK